MSANGTWLRTAGLIAAFFASGAAISWTFLKVWPFNAETQLAILFLVFIALAVARTAYGKPARPLAFLVGALLPYVGYLIWFETLRPAAG